MRERSVAAIRQQADAPIDAGRREDARRRARQFIVGRGQRGDVRHREIKQRVALELPRPLEFTVRAGRLHGEHVNAVMLQPVDGGAVFCF